MNTALKMPGAITFRLGAISAAPTGVRRDKQAPVFSVSTLSATDNDKRWRRYRRSPTSH